MKGLRRPVSSLIKGRGYVAQAAAAQSQQTTLTKQDVKISQLPSGLRVASLENNAPLTRVGIFLNAGSRFENGTNIGITHALRNAADLSGQHASGFAVTKHIQQEGANMTCATTRDHMMYSLECIRGGLERTLKYFVASVCFPAFKPHEVLTINEKVKLDLANLGQSPNIQLVEALHQAAYRNGLDNSLYMPSYALGSHTPDMLASFVKSHYTGDNMVIAATGVEHEELLEYLKKLPGGTGALTAEKSEYRGGEIRIRNKSPLVHAALVTEGAGLESPDLLPLAVLQHVMGTGPHIKYSSNIAGSKVAKAVAEATSSPFAATCINNFYTDSGLFGFQVVAQASDMAKVLHRLWFIWLSSCSSGFRYGKGSAVAGENIW